MFSPPAVMISSFFRSVTETNPSASMVPMSPVCSHPSGVDEVGGQAGPVR